MWPQFRIMKFWLLVLLDSQIRKRKRRNGCYTDMTCELLQYECSPSCPIGLLVKPR
ncbi:hypothetical protein IWW34DRAFT_641537 [Fusarium oxysporum f. sp. albedinis]|uniref:Uncharacterized protein n=1 Tax=Fusarium oxysporum (strain Fo5176) TaxID=660025 RepID=F9GEU7_FUSOF|nr:hypothetical protein FOXB_17181 [Fusarium oxysporum f. sp. conglutinans Fo5176]KAI3567829.1 hypothetical protein IWW34DRAFT_641537 [Fusarium oxysporum f. sp. albedinis]